jgi:hypothetical protein
LHEARAAGRTGCDLQLRLAVQGVLRDVKSASHRLSVQAGKVALAAMMEADRIASCGPKGVPDAGRRAVRGGTTSSAVVLGGRHGCHCRGRVDAALRQHAGVAARGGCALRDAWDAADADSARPQMQRLAASLHAKPPGAAASLREGLTRR